VRGEGGNPFYIQAGFSPLDIKNLATSIAPAFKPGWRFSIKRNWAKAQIYFVLSINPGLKSGAIVQELSSPEQ
jgi:hypothetical protein